MTATTTTEKIIKKNKKQRKCFMKSYEKNPRKIKSEVQYKPGKYLNKGCQRKRWKMKSCQEYMSELREKIHLAEDQLRVEKKNLYKADEHLTEEKERWAKEIKVEQLKVHANEKEIKRKEARLEELKSQCEETLRKCVQLEEENENMRKEIQKAKRIQQDEMNKYLILLSNLEKELNKVQEKQKDIKLANKWTKVFQDRELKAFETENETTLKDEVKQLSQDFAKKIEVFDENLKEIEATTLKARQHKLREMQEALAQVKAECEDMEKKNAELENEIRLLENMTDP